jgi:hypothetical protein
VLVFKHYAIGLIHFGKELEQIITRKLSIDQSRFFSWSLGGYIILLFQFEADRRAIIITINSFGTELTKDDRAKLYPRCGKLHPDGLAALARADDDEQGKAVAEYYAVRWFVTN